MANNATITPLGELFKIGDLIQQERPSYESRKMATLATSQTIFKGQVLTGNAALGQNVTAMVATGVVTITLGGSTSGGGGTFALRYRGMQTVAIATPATAATFVANCQAALAALPFPEMQALAMILSATTTTIAFTPGQVAVTAGNAAAYLCILAAPVGTSLTNATYFLPTTAGTAIASANAGFRANNVVYLDTTTAAAWIFTITLTDSLAEAPEVVDNLLATSGSVQITANTVYTTVDPVPTCIALQAVTTSASTAPILVLYREAMVKPGYLLFQPNTSTGVEGASAAQILAAKQQLENNQMLVILGGPTYNSSQDVVGWPNNVTEETLTLPSNQIPGL